MDILGNAAKYLYFNEKNEVLCNSCTGYNKPRNRARVIYITGRDEPFVANANGFTRLHIEVDGVYVAFDAAKCGTHDRSYSRSFKVGPDLITGDRALDFDVLRRAYIEQRDAEADRSRAQQQDYVDGLRRIALMTEDQFDIKYDIVNTRARGDTTEVTINGPTGYGTMAPVARVTLDNDYGVWKVSTSEFGGHTGRGRGSPALSRIIGRLLLDFADKADELNGVE